MSHYPAALWRPVDYHGLHRRQPWRAAILHTNGGSPQLYGWWRQRAANGEKVGAHYQVFANGNVECYVDPDWVVYHSYSASEWALGIETQDDGNPSRPWTAAQITSIAKILQFHHVPAQMLVVPNAGNGVGYHQQQSAWNGSGHDCPGSVRRRQLPLVLSALNALYNPPTPTEDDVTPEQDTRLKNIEKMLLDLTAPRRADHIDTDPAHLSLGDVLNEVDAQGGQR